MRPRLIFLGICLLFCTWFTFKTETPELRKEVMRPAKQNSPSEPTQVTTNLTDPKINSEAPNKFDTPIPKLLSVIPRHQLINSSKPAQTTTFATQTWLPIQQIMSNPTPSPVVIPAKITTPPLDFIYIGKSKNQNRWTVFLSRAGQTFVVNEGDTVQDLYRIGKIQPPLMEFIYLPLNETQSLPIGNSD